MHVADVLGAHRRRRRADATQRLVRVRRRVLPTATSTATSTSMGVGVGVGVGVGLGVMLAQHDAALLERRDLSEVRAVAELRHEAAADRHLHEPGVDEDYAPHQLALARQPVAPAPVRGAAQACE